MRQGFSSGLDVVQLHTVIPILLRTPFKTLHRDPVREICGLLVRRAAEDGGLVQAPLRKLRQLVAALI